MLKAHNISKNYGDVAVLKRVDFAVEAGEVVSIVGTSGAGKSTLLQILGTLETPDSGEILFNGKTYAKMSGVELASFRNTEIGFVFQFHNLMAELTALENVCLPGWIGNKQQDAVLLNAKNLLELLGLKHRLGHYPSQLSGGEQQRVAVARALVNNPSIVLADEPSGNLDTKNADELHQIFFDIRNQLGCSFVIVTHNEKFANLADRKLTIKDGRFV